MLERSSLAIVIPCYNESATIGEVIRGSVAQGDVFVIDDGSTDASGQIAIEAGATVVKTPGRLGYEKVIDLGLRTALDRGYERIVTIDADGEHDPAFVKQFREQLENEAIELVVGVRDKPQRLAEWIVCGYCRWRFGLKDVLCGMKGYSRSLIELYFQDGRSNLVNTLPALLWLLQGNECFQIPISGKVRRDSPRFASTLRANKLILKLLLPMIWLR